MGIRQPRHSICCTLLHGYAFSQVPGEAVFVTAEELKREYGKDYENISTAAIGLYTYYKRLAQGLRQLMAGSRKFALEHITRNDIAALTPEAARVSGIPLVSDLDTEEVEKILG